MIFIIFIILKTAEAILVAQNGAERDIYETLLFYEPKSEVLFSVFIEKRERHRERPSFARFTRASEEDPYQADRKDTKRKTRRIAELKGA